MSRPTVLRYRQTAYQFHGLFTATVIFQKSHLQCRFSNFGLCDELSTELRHVTNWLFNKLAVTNWLWDELVIRRDDWQPAQ